MIVFTIRKPALLLRILRLWSRRFDFLRPTWGWFRRDSCRSWYSLSEIILIRCSCSHGQPPRLYNPVFVPYAPIILTSKIVNKGKNSLEVISCAVILRVGTTPGAYVGNNYWFILILFKFLKNMNYSRNHIKDPYVYQSKSPLKTFD